MTLFGFFWLAVLIFGPIIFAVIAAVKTECVECGFMGAMLGYLASMMLGMMTFGTSEPHFSGGYKVPNYKRYYMATHKDGSVDVTKVVTYYKCQHGHLHTDVDYVFYSKAKNNGPVIRWTAGKNLKIEYYNGTPLIETVESYYYTGKMDWWSHLFWKEEPSRTKDAGGEVVRIYVPYGTKIKTIESNNGKRNQ